MASVIGYEGKRNERSMVSWGAAAIRSGDDLVNPTTGLRRPYIHDQIQELVAEGSLTAFEKPIEVDDDSADEALIVLEVARTENLDKFVRVSTGRAGGVVGSSRRAKFAYHIFQNRTAFDQYRKTAVEVVIHTLLYHLHEDSDADALLRAALTLDPHAPALGAYRVFRSKNPQIAKITAEASLRSDEDRARFHQLLGALQSDESDYVIKYNDGIAEGGGLDIDKALDLLHAMEDVRPLFAAQIANDYPFLATPPATRLHELRARSAEFHFASQVKNRPLGERVARYLELQLLQQSVAGKPPSKLEGSKPFQEAIRQIVQPDETTVVQHRLLGESNLEPVDHQEFKEETFAPTWSYPLTLLGYQSGLIRQGKRIEIVIAPGRSLFLSAEDNGSGQLPIGLAFLEQRDDFLFKPTLYTVTRHTDDRRREKFSILSAEALRPGSKSLITAIPSTVLNGAFVYRLGIEVSRSANGDTIELSTGDKIVNIDASALPHAQRWMREYAEVCYRQEFGDLRHARLAPARMPQPSVLLQILAALSELGGSAHQMAVITKVNEMYEKSIRTNNTRREVRQNPELLKFHGKQDADLMITPEGMRLLSVYRAIERRAQ